MIDLGRMDQSMLTGHEDKMFASMQRSIDGKNLDNMFYSEPVKEQVQAPTIDFNQWASKYAEPVQVQQQVVEPQTQPEVVQQTSPGNGGFDIDSWLNGVNSNSVKNEPVAQPQVQQAQPVSNGIDDVMNRTFQMIGQTAQEKGYNPDEIVNLAKNISTQDLLDLYEMRKHQQEQLNRKPSPGPSVVGDPSQYRVQDSGVMQIAGYGARNVRI